MVPRDIDLDRLLGNVDIPIPGDPPLSTDWDLVDEWGVQSFPASDPPANW
jgi:hypothetical protein